MPPLSWQFDANVAEIFDAHVRQSVPFYDELHRLATELSVPFVKPGTTACDVGTATGEGIFNLHRRVDDQTVSFIGIDPSHAMIAAARRRLSGLANVTLLEARVQDVKLPAIALCTCILTLGFIPPCERKAVLSQLRSSIRPDGALILVEKVVSRDSRVQVTYERCHEEYKLRSGLTREEVNAKRESIRNVLVPLTVCENLSLLSEAGFRQSDVFFGWMNFIGWIVRPNE